MAGPYDAKSDRKSIDGGRGAEGPESSAAVAHAGGNILGLVPAIRDSMTATFEIARTAALTSERSPCSDGRADDYGLDAARDLIDMLQCLGNLVAALPDGRRAATADALVALLLDEAAAAAAGDDLWDGPLDMRRRGVSDTAAAWALIDERRVAALRRVRRYARRLEDKATAAVACGPAADAALESVITSVTLWDNTDPDQQPVAVLHELFPQYVRSLTATPGTAASLTAMYVALAESVLSELKATTTTIRPMTPPTAA